MSAFLEVILLEEQEKTEVAEVSGKDFSLQTLIISAALCLIVGGIIGFAMMLLMLISLVSVLVKTASSPSTLLSITAICLLGGITAFCVHGLVDKHPPGGYAPFYTMMAMAVAAYLIDQRH